MINLFFLNLWSNIKRAPLVSLIMFFQLLLTSYMLFVALFTQGESELNNQSVQNSYGKYKIYYLMSKKNDMEEEMRSRGVTFTSISETDYSDYETFYEKVKNSESIKTALQYEIGIRRTEPLPYLGFSEDKTGPYSYYYQTSIDGNYRLNAYAIDSDFLNDFGLILDSGRLFTEDEFNTFDPTNVPVILGYSYKKFFSLGDTFEGNYLDLPIQSPNGKKVENMTFKVIGFIAEGQTFFSVGGTGPYTYDTYAVIPYLYKPLDYWFDIYEEYPGYFYNEKSIVKYYLHGLGSTFLATRHFFAEEENEREMFDALCAVLVETGLGEFYEPITPDATAVQFADKSQETAELLVSLLYIMLFLSLLSIIFASINNASKNIKAYAIHSLMGASWGQIIFFSVLETFTYGIWGFGAGFLWFNLNITITGLSGHPAYSFCLKMGSVIIGIFILFACAFSGVFVLLKLKSYSISSLIRGREVKKGRSLPVYKVILFIMLILVSICLTFSNSYSWQIDHIDRYQRHFFTKNAHVLYVSPLPQENAPQIDLDYKNIPATDYSFDLLISTYYDPVMGPAIRGTYYSGDVDVPNIISGRYFTQDEVETVCNNVVVGKNVLKDFVVEKNGELIFTHNEKDYNVIGIMGREDHETTIDEWVFFTLPTINSIYGNSGVYIVDADTERAVLNTLTLIQEQADGTASFSTLKYSSKMDIGVSKNLLDMFMILVYLTATVFCVYYLDKIQHIINVKKFLGYSKIMIFADTAGSFIFISTIAFAVGNAAMWVLSKTLLKDFILFSAFRINLPVLTFSFGMILLIAFLFSILAINKAFRGSARDLKRN
ncbi:MAG: ABC transporter permease [Ruminococcaceae bacterium]|nr:ABC transporter permease [Oscillospiraceae bacterium]